MKKNIILIVLLIAVVAFPMVHYLGDNIYGAFAFSKSDVIQVDENTYRCSKDNYKDFINYMKDNGWIFVEQLGAGYRFKKDNKKVICIHSAKKFYAKWELYYE